MAKMAHLWGLPTLEPSRQSVGACLSLGVKPKGRRGFPEQKDRFHVVMAKTQERGQGKGKIDFRPHDPRFAAFNDADIETRRVFYAMLCYHREQECWHPSYGMYRFPKGSNFANPRTKCFACIGNGTTAERWLDGGAAAIPCPGEGCPFRQGDSAPCKPRARFWFMPRWLPSQGKEFARWMKDGSITNLLERPIMRLATQSREARDTFGGMLEEVREQAKPLGGVRSWYGMPFVMTLGPASNPEKKTKWYETTFTLGGDWFEWLKWQAAEFGQLAAAKPLVALGSASAAELDGEAVGAEHAAIVPYVAPIGPAVKPAVTVEPAPEGEARPEGSSPEAERRSPPTSPASPSGPLSTSDKIEAWMEENGFKGRKSDVTRALSGADLVDKGKRWYDCAEEWSSVKPVLDTLAEKGKS